MSVDTQIIAQLDFLQEVIDSEAVTLNPPDPYRFPVISYKPRNGKPPTNIYRYSRSEIAPIYEPLFNTSRKILRKNIEKAFGTESGNISYELLMCGTSPETAKPALVVRCAVNVMENVQKVLTQERLLKRCHLRPHGAAARLVRRIKQSVGILVDQDELTLGLEVYGCGTATRPPVRTELRGKVLDPSDTGSSGYDSCQRFSTLYGAKINYIGGKASATLSGVIQIGTKFYGLTTSHPFRNACPLKSRWSKRHHIGNMKGRIISAEIILQGHDRAIQTKVWVPHVVSSIPNLDWALVLLNGNILKHSLKIKTSISERPSISACALKHPGWEPDVLILSFGKEPIRGTLLEGTVYFTDGLSTEVGVWTLALDEDNPVQRGDSGSLVIDADTGVAYGYVVARDAFGRAEIIPLHEALHQISNLTSIDHVTFADEVSQAYESDLVSYSTEVSIDSHLVSPTSPRVVPVILEEAKAHEITMNETVHAMRSGLSDTIEVPVIGHREEIADATRNALPWTIRTGIYPMSVCEKECLRTMLSSPIALRSKTQASAVATDLTIQPLAKRPNKESKPMERLENLRSRLNNFKHTSSRILVKGVPGSSKITLAEEILDYSAFQPYIDLWYITEESKLKRSASIKFISDLLEDLLHKSSSIPMCPWHNFDIHLKSFLSFRHPWHNFHDQSSYAHKASLFEQLLNIYARDLLCVNYKHPPSMCKTLVMQEVPTMRVMSLNWLGEKSSRSGIGASLSKLT